MADSVVATIEEHPAISALAVVIVALFAYKASQSSANRAPQYTLGGVRAGSDPNAAAIEEAAISAGAAGVNAIASVIASGNQTRAQRDISLAQIEASQEVQDRETDASVTNTATITGAAVQTAALQAQASAANAKLNADAQAKSLDTAKAISRGQDNTRLGTTIIQQNPGIIDSVIHWIGSLI